MRRGFQQLPTFLDKKDRIIKVAGYVKKVVYNNNIEYRNFSPDLVGQQFATNFGTPLFTMGNFSITTNTDPSEHTVFKLGTYSKKYTFKKDKPQFSTCSAH